MNQDNAIFTNSMAYGTRWFNAANMDSTINLPKPN